MQAFKAILYGGAAPLAGTPVVASFSGDNLCIQTLDLTINLAEVNVSVGGFEHSTLFINWQHADGTAYSIQPASAHDTTQLLAQAPPILKLQFPAWHQRRRSIKLVWGTLTTLAVVVLLSVFLIWWQYDAVVSWVANQVSIKNEVALGDSVLQQLEADGDIIKTGLAVNTVKKIGTRLTKGSKYNYRWFIQKNKSVNAFALPGGIIVINSALIEKTDNADELAAVIAHEVQHVEQRHALKGMIKSLGWAVGLMAVLGDVSAATAVIAHQVGVMYFSRDIESEADKLGYQALLRAHIKPDGMVSFFQKLEHEQGKQAPEWISSHPDTANRIAAIQTLIKEQPCGDCLSLTIDWEKVKRNAARLK